MCLTQQERIPLAQTLFNGANGFRSIGRLHRQLMECFGDCQFVSVGQELRHIERGFGCARFRQSQAASAHQPTVGEPNVALFLENRLFFDKDRSGLAQRVDSVLHK